MVSQIHKAAAIQMHKWLQTADENCENLFSPNFVSMHPAGGKVLADSFKPKDWIPNTNQWPKPEGSHIPPSYNPLTSEIEQHLHNSESLKEFHIALTNKVETKLVFINAIQHVLNTLVVNLNRDSAAFILESLMRRVKSLKEK